MEGVQDVEFLVSRMAGLSKTAGKQSEDGKSLSDPVNDPLSVTALVNEVATIAILDSGSIDHSVITVAALERFGLQIDRSRVADVTAVGVNKEPVPIVGHTALTTIRHGLHSCLTSFLVLRKHVLGDVVLGLPDMRKLSLIREVLEEPLSVSGENEAVPPRGNKLLSQDEEEISNR